MPNSGLSLAGMRLATEPIPINEPPGPRWGSAASKVLSTPPKFTCTTSKKPWRGMSGPIGQIPGVFEEFYAISIDKRVGHPSVNRIADAARAEQFECSGELSY